MQNNVGIYASQISGHLYSGPYGSYDSLATITLSASTASITFAGIPQGYKHLQIRINGKMDRTSAAYGDYQISVNNDTSYSYALHQLIGNGSSASAGATTTAANLGFWSFSRLAGNTVSNLTGVAILDILDYSDSTKNKTVRQLGGTDANGSGEIVLQSGLYLKSSPITSIQFTPGYGSSNFIAPTSIALYGVK
jgi:hypothetical protein